MDRSGLKVLYISRDYTTHDYRFLDSFVRAGWAPVHLPIVGGRLETRPLPAGASAFPSLGDRADRSASWRTKRDRFVSVMAQVLPDVVLAGPVQSGAFIAALARARPLIAVSWGTDLLVDADATAFSKFVTRHTLSSSDAVFGDCRAVREAVRRNSGIEDERIVTFPWGIDLLRFTPGPSSSTLRHDRGWEGNEIFISTRSWEPVYAIDVLVRAFAEVVRHRPTARLLLLGDGSEERTIRSLVTELQIGECIHMAGRVPYDLLADYFRAADVYVSSALSDGTSVSLLEAMACGLPVVVSDSFGNLEWVEEGVNGRLAKAGDADSLCGSMLALLDDGSNRSVMSAANVATARERANWDANFPALVRLVEDVTHAHGTR